MDRRIYIGPELEALRKTKFYLELRPFIKAKGKKYPFFESALIHDDDDRRDLPCGIALTT